jgi:hypothetical protein
MFKIKITAFFLMLLGAACTSPQSPTSMVKVPDKLKPGANELLAMIVPAKGVQIYECRARKDQVGVYERQAVQTGNIDTPEVEKYST